ncbi:MAG: hypothetical protein RR413_11500 [Christensenellaceae bacterium]
MQLEDFEKWTPIKDAATMYYIENIFYEDGVKIRFTEANGYGSIKSVKTFVAHFLNSVSYFEVDETYSDGFWVDKPSKAWTFFKTDHSPYIDYLQQNSIFAATISNPVHYVFVTVESIFHIISTDEPTFLL